MLLTKICNNEFQFGKAVTQNAVSVDSSFVFLASDDIWSPNTECK